VILKALIGGAEGVAEEYSHYLVTMSCRSPENTYYHLGHMTLEGVVVRVELVDLKANVMLTATRLVP